MRFTYVLRSNALSNTLVTGHLTSLSNVNVDNNIVHTVLSQLHCTADEPGDIPTVFL